MIRVLVGAEQGGLLLLLRGRCQGSVRVRATAMNVLAQQSQRAYVANVRQVVLLLVLGHGDSIGAEVRIGLGRRRRPGVVMLLSVGRGVVQKWQKVLVL